MSSVWLTYSNYCRTQAKDYNLLPALYIVQYNCSNNCTMLPKEYAGEFHMISGWFDHEPVPTTVQHSQTVLWESFT